MSDMLKYIQIQNQDGSYGSQIPLSVDSVNVFMTNDDNLEVAMSKKADKTEVQSLQAAVGSPLTAITASAMIDTNKIYVYTGSETGYTNGDWYYWNGTAWIDGGIYNAVALAIDPTLTQSGQAADAKVTGDEITSLNDELSDLESALDDKVDYVLYANSLKKDTEISAIATGDNATITINGNSTPVANNSYGRFPVTAGEKYMIVGKSDAPQALYAQYSINSFGTYIAGSAVQNDTANIYKSEVFTALGSYVFISFGTLNDLKLYHLVPIIAKSELDVIVGPFAWCDYANVDAALNGITDDSPTKQYTIRVLAGTYPSFSMRHTDAERTQIVNNARWINIIGDDPYTVKFFDNRGNRDLSPCNIFTNGRVENITFQVEADAEHYTPTETQTSCYAVHQDYNTCNTQYINCRFLSNVGPGYGAGLFKNSNYELINCYFESTCDNSFGTGARTGQGAIFVHTYASLYKAVNQNLKIVDSIAVATAQPNGGRFAVIGSSETGYGSTYDFNFQNFGCFGQNGAQVNLQDPDSDLLGRFNFNNLPSVLNTVVQ